MRIRVNTIHAKAISRSGIPQVKFCERQEPLGIQRCLWTRALPARTREQQGGATPRPRDPDPAKPKPNPATPTPRSARARPFGSDRPAQRPPRPPRTCGPDPAPAPAPPAHLGRRPWRRSTAGWRRSWRAPGRSGPAARCPRRRRARPPSSSSRPRPRGRPRPPSAHREALRRAPGNKGAAPGRVGPRLDTLHRPRRAGPGGRPAPARPARLPHLRAAAVAAAAGAAAAACCGA